MTTGLRKAHKYIWLLLIVALPVVMICATIDLDYSVSSKQTTFSDDTIKEGIVAKFENEIIKANVYENSLEVELKSTLRSASTVLYEMDSQGNKLDLIGQLATPRMYKFQITDLPVGIIVYDEIKKTEITKFKF